MVKKLAIILWLTYALGATPFRELLRLPDMWQHYSLHVNSTAGKSLSFYQFLVAHYSSTTQHTHAGNQHAELPFKQFSGNQNLVVEPLVHTMLSPVPELDTGILVWPIPSDPFKYAAAFKGSIFQPPRV